MKILNTLMSLAFAMSAIVQYNDPDPWLWIVIYILGIAACLSRFRRHPSWKLPSIVAAAGLLWIGFLVPALQDSAESIIWSQVFMNTEMKTFAVELTREIGGLGILVVWMIVLAVSAYRFENRSRFRQ